MKELESERQAKTTPNGSVEPPMSNGSAVEQQQQQQQVIEEKSKEVALLEKKVEDLKSKNNVSVVFKKTLDAGAPR